MTLIKRYQHFPFLISIYIDINLFVNIWQDFYFFLSICYCVSSQRTVLVGSYVGCYEASYFRKDYTTSFANATVPLCLIRCKSKGFQYAGLQNGADCFCSCSAPCTEGLHGNERCAVPCNGDLETFCGGEPNTAIQAYQSTQASIDFNYIPYYILKYIPEWFEFWWSASQ